MAHRGERFISCHPQTLLCRQTTHVAARLEMEQHALSICPHAKQHRHGLIDRQTGKPVIGETPRGESRDRYAGRIGQLLTQIMEYSTVKHAFRHFSVKVYLYSRDGGSTA